MSSIIYLAVHKIIFHVTRKAGQPYVVTRPFVVYMGRKGAWANSTDLNLFPPPQAGETRRSSVRFPTVTEGNPLFRASAFISSGSVSSNPKPETTR